MKMALDKTFKKQEKLEAEKPLEVVANEESAKDELVFKLVDYFMQNMPSWEREQVFDLYKKDLQNFQISPGIISKINIMLSDDLLTSDQDFAYKGVFLTALIQTSYDQGNNNFEFEEVEARWFGADLRGREDERINIVVKTLTGNSEFRYAEDFVAKIETYIEGNIFWDVKRADIEITNYMGHVFGWNIEDCTVYSPDKGTLKVLKKQFDERDARSIGNEFILGNMPEEAEA